MIQIAVINFFSGFHVVQDVLLFHLGCAVVLKVACARHMGELTIIAPLVDVSRLGPGRRDSACQPQVAPELSHRRLSSNCLRKIQHIK